MSLPLEEGAVVVATDGAIYSLDAAGRRLWEALHAGWSPDDLVMAAAHKGWHRGECGARADHGDRSVMAGARPSGPSGELGSAG